MANSTMQLKIEELKEILYRLEAQPLSEDSRAILQAVNTNLDELDQAAWQAGQEKSKFVSVVTHELRIPMTSIKGYTDLLRQGVVGPVNEQQLNFLEVIRNNVERMGALVSDLSDITRSESGRLKMDIAEIAVQEPVEEALENIRPKFATKTQKLALEYAPDLPLVYADPARLRQILANLVNNANKYTPEGGKVRIVIQAQGDFVRLQVIDNGIGINQEDQEHIFTQFFRSEDPAVREEQGWGLGLAVAKHLVGLMGGNIGFTSCYGEGSVFWFTLPTSDKRGRKGE